MQALRGWGLSIVFALLVILSQFALGKSVYCVTHDNCKLLAYEINGDQISFQKDLSLPDYGWGVIDVTIDSVTGVLFVTSEANVIGGNKIILVNARNMEYIKTLTLNNGEENMSGIVVDEYAGKVYSIDRNTNKLYIYNWDRINYELTLAPRGENPVLLEDIVYANGVALDEANGILYVAEYNYTTGYYDTIYSYDRDSDWALIETIDFDEYAVDIDIDTTNSIIYSGAYYGHNKLIKKDLTITDPGDPNYVIATDIGATVAGVAVDSSTGLVYVTTFRNNGQIEVWDTSDWPLDPDDPNNPIVPTDQETDLAYHGPAGICVPKINISYKPDTFIASKTDNVTSAGLNDFVTYTITFDPNDGVDNTNVTVADYMPLGVFFSSADPNTGYIDSELNAYIWEIGTVEDDDPPVSVEITVQILSSAEPTGTVDNIATIESDTAYTIVQESTPIDCFGGDIIYVDAFATGYGNGTTWADAYNKLEDALARVTAGCGNEIWVANGVYVPGDSNNDTFDIDSDVDIYGGFAGGETAISQRKPARNLTYICGDDICNNVISISANTTVTLDGLIVTGASEDGIVLPQLEMDKSFKVAILYVYF